MKNPKNDADQFLRLNKQRETTKNCLSGAENGSPPQTGQPLAWSFFQPVPDR